MRIAQRASSRLCFWGLAMAALSGGHVTSVRAGDSTEQCLQGYERGQRLRQAGDLVSAASALRVCGGPSCPARMQGDCQRWLDDVDRSTPTVVFRVRGDQGEQLPNVSVAIDGAEARRLDGRALLMNPGEHRLVFEHAGYQRLDTPVFVTEGEKLEPRVIVLKSLMRIDLADAFLPTDPGEGAGDGTRAVERGTSISPWPLALGAMALAGGGGFVYFGVRAKIGEKDLELSSPDCSQPQVDDVKSDYLWSDASLGVAAASLIGAGLWLLFAEPSAQAASGRLHPVQFGRTTTWEMRF